MTDITDERIAELRRECEPLPPKRPVIFVTETDFDADPSAWIACSGPTQEVAVHDGDGDVSILMGGRYRLPLDVERDELRAILDRLAAAERERDEARWSAEMACQEPPEMCDCAGCSLARERW